MIDPIEALLHSLKVNPPQCIKCRQPIAFDDIRIITIRRDGKPMSAYCCRQHAEPVFESLGDGRFIDRNFGGCATCNGGGCGDCHE